jgi:hypothetical protein
MRPSGEGDERCGEADVAIEMNNPNPNPSFEILRIWNPSQAALCPPVGALCGRKAEVMAHRTATNCRLRTTMHHQPVCMRSPLALDKKPLTNVRESRNLLVRKNRKVTHRRLRRRPRTATTTPARRRFEPPLWTVQSPEKETL